ncbi:MAG TPA: hypothetical protein DEF35_18255 [Paenibacillus sp.]|uniref:hypothetical protein n=1 Tax=Paenibacillus TaxID=44249 RepID=UPI000BA0D02F|nr:MULTISPECIES: hypothetical protein [Paenibacillus]OZQ62726.1 hypothetical protein CA599_25665 [Paenibacillus taichungensis]HBU83560.1 hypothetical protein [Paenibacillus sp.]
MEYLDRKVIPILYSQRGNEVDDQNGAEEELVTSAYKPQAVASADLPTMLRISKENVFLKRTELYDSRVSISLPRSLRLISEKEASIKYPSSHRPEWIYTNDSGTVNFTFNRLEHRISEAELTSFTETMANVVRGTQPVRQWDKHGVRTTEMGHVMGYCQFSVQGLNNQIYNHIGFTILDQSVLVYGFNCTDEEKRDWQEPGEMILNSLAIL